MQHDPAIRTARDFLLWYAKEGQTATNGELNYMIDQLGGAARKQLMAAVDRLQEARYGPGILH